MSFIHPPSSFRTELQLADRGIPEILILVGASDADGTLKQLKRTLHAKQIKATALPGVYTGFIYDRLIAFGSTYATSLTADIVHAYSAIGVKRIAFFGFCGAVRSPWQRGDTLSPTIIHDGVGIFKAYGIKQKTIRTSRTSNAVRVLTWHNLYSETTELVRTWNKSGIDVVDLETAAVVAACQHKQITPHIQLIVADQLHKKERLQQTYQTSFFELCVKRNELINIYLNY